MKIGIIGAGMFGFSLSYHLGKKHFDDPDIKIMCYDLNKQLIDHLEKYRMHLYHFGNKQLFPNTVFTNDIKNLVENTNILIIAVTSQAIRDTIRNIKLLLKDDIIIINTSKALERNTGKIFSQVIAEELSEINIKYTLAKLSGGTFAIDIINEAPLGVDIACENQDVMREIQNIFHDRRLRVYGNNDLTGVEYAGAFKNIIAIFAGIVNGLGMPYGSETHMISRAAKEAKDIAMALGAKPYTFSMGSQCWGNDLWMSCTGKSRNREYGYLIGSGYDPEEAWIKMKSEHRLVEGYFTVESIPILLKNSQIKAPILQEIYNIVYNGKNPKSSIGDLMFREIENIE